MYEWVAVVWLAVTRSRSPISRARVARVSRPREASSSISSQWTSTSRSNSWAREHAKLSESTEYSRVNSKCGIAPMTSTPMPAARRMSASPSGNDWMPSWGNATICRVTESLSSSRSSSIAVSAVRSGSVTSTWVRTYWMPKRACWRTARWTRSFTSSIVSEGLRSLHTSMPSKRVPDSFQRGSPAVSAESRWTCDSMMGGSASRPSQSTTSSPSRGVRFSSIAVNTPSSTRMSQGVSASSMRRFVNSTSGLLRGTQGRVVGRAWVGDRWIRCACGRAGSARPPCSRPRPPPSH